MVRGLLLLPHRRVSVPVFPAVRSKTFMNDVVASFTFPSPPAVNNLYFDRIMPPKYPRPAYVMRVLTDEGRRYKAIVAQILEGWAPIIGDVELTIRWFRPRRVGDIDNIHKILLDSMTGFIYNDDGQVSRLFTYRLDTQPKRPRVEVDVRPLDLF